MTRKLSLAFILISLISGMTGCTPSEKKSWKPAESPLYTKWSAAINTESCWTEYPRPQLVRKTWINLNGLWDLTISEKNPEIPRYQGEILVPFPVESALSGVGLRLDPEHILFYKRVLEIPKDWKEKTILLHFEAIDWQAKVFIDGREAGSHKGGYDPFSLDITSFITPGEKHVLKVWVQDPSDLGFQPHGKQVSNPRGIWYTPSSGIWQTVWMEPVERSYIEDLKLTPDIDGEKLIVQTNIAHSENNTQLEITVKENDRIVFTGRFKAMDPIEVPVQDAKLWSPEDPFLYDLNLRLLQDGQITDEVESYFGMRKIALQKDLNGFVRLALNNTILFMNGPLDQGFWPDGLYTPPTDEAMRYDLEQTRAMGFNMLRKHVKIENRRFYAWCDRIGMLVWQDMPNAPGFISPTGEDLDPGKNHREQFEYELREMIHTLYNHPSVVMWVPFNEGWGQYDTERIVDLVRAEDSTRLINSASGWTDRGVGDVIDIHHYPDPQCPVPETTRASVLGEFGGLGLFIEGHTWQSENWGYEKLQDASALLLKYEDYYREIDRMKSICGLAAVVYTQTTDVETETNGLMTYDRAQIKMGVENIGNAHKGIIPPRLTSPLRTFVDSITLDLIKTDPESRSEYLQASRDGKDAWMPYESPFYIKNNSTLKIRSVWPDGTKSREYAVVFEKVNPTLPVTARTMPGLKTKVFEGNWTQIPDFSGLVPVAEGRSEKADLEMAPADTCFGMTFEGYLDVPATEVYLIYFSSDDGARLFIDQNKTIDYDGIHGMGIRTVERALEKGLHPFRLEYFQRYSGLGLKISWETKGMERGEITSKYYRCKIEN